MLNGAQFSAAKTAAEGKMLQSAVFDEENQVKSFSKYEKDAKEITDISQKTWLRVEYETCRRQAVQGEQFRQMQNDADLYPYWVYRGMMDDREREDHVEMEGLVFKIGDSAADDCFPPNDFNCRCSAETVDDDYLSENKLTTLSNDQAKQYRDDNVDEQFRYNAGVDGMMPSDGSYFDVLGSANDADYKTFDMGDAEGDEELEGLAAKGLHQLVEVVNDWRDSGPVNKKGDIVFQNKNLLTNVRFTNRSLHEVNKNPRGFENIPNAIRSPDEVWSDWENADEQRKVRRNYIIFGKVSYVVQTLDGEIINAFAVSKKSVNKYRIGVIL
jgi:SPP1 gp7 family putative phage head morphogenesis protein